MIWNHPCISAHGVWNKIGIWESQLTLVEFLIFGTGEQSIPAPKEIKDYISSLGIQLDVMDSVSLLILRQPNHTID